MNNKDRIITIAPPDSVSLNALHKKNDNVRMRQSFKDHVPLFTANTANSILFLFNIRWTRMKCYLQYSQWITERSQG